ncbi:GNAT family N-acetyltransferase [Caulobacter sp. KR2-114]|uniref:GNAT family N-acetyltransferase n=1 Tax=Caulobacter sp. KR2-114 TaxID=3400912 RepID=UPI003C0A8DA8
MDRAALLAAFDAQMRSDPPPEAGVARVWVPYGAGRVLRTVGAYNFIGWWSLTPQTMGQAADGEATYFRALGQEAEWKVFSHDQPAGLERALATAGFVAGGPETFLAIDLAEATLAAPRTEGISVRRVTDRAGVDDLVAANSAAFGKAEPWRADALAPRLNDGSLALFVAYADDGRPVSSGRLELAPGRDFAGLYGGGTDPAFRGRGVYRALVAARADEARRLGVRYLTVDARETSRPILQRLGFTPLATITGWEIHP